MDPIAHTLVGGALAATGLRKASPLGTAALLIGANLPDVDAVMYAIGDDVSLAVRRGWTHGALAVVLWPLALTGALLLVDRLRRERRPELPRARPRSLLLLSMVAVLSHPALDWLNIYGIRLLMPFDGHWFYGDTLFIADPWIWIIVGTGAAGLAARHRLGATVTLATAAGTSALMLFTALAPPGAKIAWCALLMASGTVVATRPDGSRGARLALVCLGIAAIYVGAMRFGTEHARDQAARWFASHGIAANVAAALPIPADPFTRDVIGRTENDYHFVTVNWVTGDVRTNGPNAIVGGPTPITDAALRAPWVRGLSIWLRFPSFDVRRRGDGYRVFIRDVRFWRPDREWGVIGFGRSVVDLDASLHPVPLPRELFAASPLRRLGRDHPCLWVIGGFGSSVEVRRRF